jgi:hypothetical protein
MSDETAKIIGIILAILATPKVFIETAKSYLDLKDKIAQRKKPQDNQRAVSTTSLMTRIRSRLSDIFSAASLLVVSYGLVKEYLSTEPITREVVLNIALLYAVILYNIGSLSFNWLNRQLTQHAIDIFQMIVSLAEDVYKTPDEHT